VTDYNTMTAQQCADWLAERDGWTWRPYADSDSVRLWSHPDKLDMLEYRGIIGCDNGGPYKLTLDAAAAALREPWDWDYVDWWEDGIEAGIINAETRRKKANLAPDELTARYRAAVAARMEDER